MHKIKSAFNVICLAAGMAATLGAAPTLTLSPNGNLTGAPGVTVGWGFTLTNNLNWVEVVQAQFCLDAVVVNPCFNASPRFTDIISNPPNDVIVGPGGSVTQVYNPVLNLGLGSYTIDPASINGAVVSGKILLTYNTFNADPNAGGMQTGFNDAISVNASVTASSVPEPASAGLVGLALLGLAVRSRRPS